MPVTTSPYVETQQVVTGIIYQLSIGEEEGGPGITRMDIGPYEFPGVPPKVKYPEAVTNELCPPDWHSIRWFTDEDGKSWLRWEGGVLRHSEGVLLFQMTSNYPPSSTAASLYVWRGRDSKPEKYQIDAPDYTLTPPKINTRHDVVGQGSIFQSAVGCAPPTVALLGVSVVAILRHIFG